MADVGLFQLPKFAADINNIISTQIFFIARGTQKGNGYLVGLFHTFQEKDL